MGEWGWTEDEPGEGKRILFYLLPMDDKNDE
jgi:hypothetical protein